MKSKESPIDQEWTGVEAPGVEPTLREAPIFYFIDECDSGYR